MDLCWRIRMGTGTYYRPEGDSLILDKRIFFDVDGFGVRSFLDETDSTLLIAGNNGMFRFVVRPERWLRNAPEPSLVLSKTQPAGPDSIIGIWKKEMVKEIVFGEKLAFSIATGDFSIRKLTKVRSKVEGVDSTWTPYTSESHRVLERLPAGKYRILVQSKNQYNRESPVAERMLVVIPPWYWSNSAKAFYLLVIILIMAGLVFGIRWFYCRRQNYLEGLVAARTSDLEAEKARADAFNLQLAEQTSQLRQVIDQRRMLTSMVIHDLKNPLGAVRGYAELITGPGTETEEVEEIANRIVWVTQRMLQTISGLLQQDQVASTLDAHPVNISEITLNLLGEMMVLATRKQQMLRSRIELDCWVRIPDSGCLRPT